MEAPHYGYVCRSLTTFDADANFDAFAFCDYLERFIEPDIAYFVASSGSGLGQALSWEDLRSVYTTAVSTGKGRVTVGANIPEQYTARASLEHAKLAIECGIDVVNIYGPDGRHGYKASDAEYLAYFDYILQEITHPISLNPLPEIGYTPKPAVIAAITNKYPQVVQIVMTGLANSGTYFTELNERLDREVALYPVVPGSMNVLAAGAAVLAGSAANLLPRTIRRYLSAVASRDYDAAATEYRYLDAIRMYIAPWRVGAQSRMTPMFLRLFKLPGANGRLPQPFVMFDDASYEKFAAGMLELEIPELKEMAQAAGV